MRIFLILGALACVASSLYAAHQPEGPYTAIEVDPFTPIPGVAFPADYQTGLADDIAREASLQFRTAIIVRLGQEPPVSYRVLRIAGVVTRFKPGNRAKRYLIGFGAGATVVEAEVELIDAGTGQVLLRREMKGVTWTGVAGGDSKAAGESLARKIAKLCNSAHLIESK